MTLKDRVVNFAQSDAGLIVAFAVALPVATLVISELGGKYELSIHERFNESVVQQQQDRPAFDLGDMRELLEDLKEAESPEMVLNKWQPRLEPTLQ